MEVTLVELRAYCRVDLNDTGVNPKISDADLNTFVNDAIVLWSSEAPFPAKVTVTLAANEYVYPEDCVRPWRVHGQFSASGTNEFIRRASSDDLKGAWQSESEPICFIPQFPEAGKYYLPRVPKADFTLYYGARRARLPDDVATLDLVDREWGVDAIRALAAYKVHNPRSVFRARLEQFAGPADKNVGNPLHEEADRWLAEYVRIMRIYRQASTLER